MPPGKALRDFWWLLRGQLLVLRDQWYWYLVQASFVPVSMLIFLWLLSGRNDAATMPQFVVGSLVSGLSFGAMLSLGQELGGLKDLHAYDHYATLPISRTPFVAAIATRGMLLALPSAVVVLAIGRLAFGIAVTPPVIAILIISGYALAGFGAVIGFLSPTAQVASLATQILQTVIMNFGPIYLTMASLPELLQWFARIWPTTYTAEALRAAVDGAPMITYAVPVIILIGFAAVSLLVVPRRMSWRQR